MSQKVTPLHGNSTRADSKFSVRKLTMTAMLGAVATVLMYISVSVPLMPSFIKLDLSELPALIASFALGPLSGVAVCLIKNLINLFFSTTGGVGELSNFLLGAIFVFVAGMFYRYMGGRKGALIGSLCGAAAWRSSRSSPTTSWSTRSTRLSCPWRPSSPCTRPSTRTSKRSGMR